MYQPGTLVEIVIDANHIIGAHMRPGLRGTIIKYLGRNICFGQRYAVEGDAYLVDFGIDNAVCSSQAIRRVPPDPGQAPTTWDACPWKPALRTQI